MVAIGCALMLMQSLNGHAAGADRPQGNEERSDRTGSTGLAPVSGEACYEHGDNETPIQGANMARALARQRAVEQHAVFVESASRVEQLQLTKDVLITVSGALLRQEKTTKENRQGKNICIGIAALLDPAEVQALITERIKNRELIADVQTPLAAHSAFGLKVWTNKNDGVFHEGEQMIVFVQSDRDAYLKLDYYQVDGEVVHLVPNLYGGEAFIRAGKVYQFGGKGSPYQFTVKPPFGEEALQAIASAEPFGEKLTATRSAENAGVYRGTLKRGLEATYQDQPVGTPAAGSRLAEAMLTLRVKAKGE
jgi:hypothetical protein